MARKNGSRFTFHPERSFRSHKVVYDADAPLIDYPIEASPKACGDNHGRPLEFPRAQRPRANFADQQRQGKIYTQWYRVS